MGKNNFHFIGGILAGLVSGLVAHQCNFSNGESVMVGTVVLMAYWWMTEAIKIYITALLPVVIFPFTGILSMKEVAPLYLQEVIFLFIGGFLMAYAIERTNLHKRVALRMILAGSDTSARILFGFMLASYILSMWILNTATVTILIPAVLAILSQLGKQSKKLATPLLLGIAYASSIGGMTTLVGTAPNMILSGMYNSEFTKQPDITFASWMGVGLPISLVLFTTVFLILRWKYLRKFKGELIDLSSCREEYKSLGKVSQSEKIVFFLFTSMTVAWITFKPIEFETFTLFGWSKYFPEPEFLKESTIAIAFALITFMLPRPKGKELLVWKDFQKLPLGILFLFGSGYALVAGFDATELTARIKEGLEFTTTLQPIMTVFALCLVMTFLTEMTSNTASINLFIPIMFPLAKLTSGHPLEIILPVTLCSSCAFMLPVATPPNTIVFGTERLPIKEMVRTGVVLNIISVILVVLLTRWII